MRHTKKHCWNLVGCPKKFNRPSGMRANSVTPYQSDVDATFFVIRSTTDIPPYNEMPRRMITVPEDEIVKLRQRMSQLESSMAALPTSSSSFLLTQSGTHTTVFHVSSSPSES